MKSRPSESWFMSHCDIGTVLICSLIMFFIIILNDLQFFKCNLVVHDNSRRRRSKFGSKKEIDCGCDGDSIPGWRNDGNVCSSSILNAVEIGAIELGV